MSDGPTGPDDFDVSPYDEFLARFFGPGAGQPIRRVDIGQLMTEQTRELVRDAAAQAATWGDSDLDTDHLLWALTRQDSIRRLLAAAGADPEAIAREIEARAGRPPTRRGPLTLTPSAKRALLDAHQIVCLPQTRRTRVRQFLNQRGRLQRSGLVRRGIRV